MKRLLVGMVMALFGLIGLVGLVEAKTVNVRGYYRSNGTYVNSYYRTSPNSYRYDNYSARGNYNPYTGRRGYIGW